MWERISGNTYREIHEMWWLRLTYSGRMDEFIWSEWGFFDSAGKEPMWSLVRYEMHSVSGAERFYKWVNIA